MSQSFLRYKTEAKRGIKYTIMVTGPSGTGKTTFVNSVLDASLLAHKFQPRGKTIDEPKVLSYLGDANNNYDHREFTPFNKNLEDQTMAITSSSIEISDEDDSKILLSVLDTPGFGENLDNEVCFEEITNYLRQQFDHVLAEETRIRRNPKFEDTRVHVCLYFIEATGHGLREIDVECMKRLSKFVNVLPVIGKADSFTASELAAFKKNIIADIEKYSVPVFEFNYDEEEDDDDTIEENIMLQKLQPFAVISSKEKKTIDGDLKYVRSYPWGDIVIDDASDFLRLKNVLFGSHLQDFKDLTTNFLYENYRSDKLSSVTEEDKKKKNSNDDVNPSLSNLAALTLEESASEPQIKTEELSTPKLNSISQFNRDAAESSPIKEISRAIRDDNQHIISNIKNSPKLTYSPDPSRNKLRVISETVPYVLKHEEILSRQQRLQELEERSARELAQRAAALEKKAAELKKRERLLRSGSIATSLRKEDTLTDLSSILKREDSDI
ncbi:hypothetical protein WICPIJ_003397 [Wickerhamomyces pijperi]|uniref:Septin-type G domain-containing protein n=1 Tax=Wickerhamomyces pijperi TaxID=599730 RepID=A0A9P8Q9P4_WICPI|nr:hypothetical protein WICPIJ_003397 [Wickerhamomyces pijperi]